MSVFVVIPCYKVSAHICDVIRGIGNEVDAIIVVDDCCPEKSGKLIEKECGDIRVSVIYQDTNQGVGAAVMTGYRAAIEAGAEVIVKIDGDGQMDSSLISKFVEPIIAGEADYTKGNRFFDFEEIHAMPKVRLFGNAVLSFMTKLSSGYWNLFDPTNGYTAIHASVANHLPFRKISHRYFFESDMLFRLNTLRAVIVDIPMDANYGEEISNLKVSKIIGEFLFKHTRNFFKRIFYNYYLRDLSLASIELPIGLAMFLFGIIFGGYHWLEYSQLSISTPAGTVMLAAMPMLMGLQLLLAFVGYDIASVPNRPLHQKLSHKSSHFKGSNG